MKQDIPRNHIYYHSVFNVPESFLSKGFFYKRNIAIYVTSGGRGNYKACVVRTAHHDDMRFRPNIGPNRGDHDSQIVSYVRCVVAVQPHGYFYDFTFGHLGAFFFFFLCSLSLNFTLSFSQAYIKSKSINNCDEMVVPFCNRTTQRIFSKPLFRRGIKKQQICSLYFFFFFLIRDLYIRH